MLSNFIQKPIGIVTLLGAAVGGPYVAFETDAGTQMRQSLVNRLAQSPNVEKSATSNSESSDPYSLVSASSNLAPAGLQSGSPNFAPNSGGIVSTVYGQPTLRTIGPPTPQQQMQMQSVPNVVGGSLVSNPTPYLETRSGPATAVPGTTDQLWDYTLGTPSLNQIQQQPNAAVGGGVVNDLREVLRFDIVPGWLPQRFARVSTVTSNVQMDALRVPLITGTQAKDIAGTLTYYFDASQALKRINLQGLTGDPTQLANLMVQFYQLTPEPSLGGKLYTTRWNNRITSVMQIAPAPVIYAGADHSKYIIFLELNQPSNQYGLSIEASEVLRTAEATQRW